MFSSAFAVEASKLCWSALRSGPSRPRDQSSYSAEAWSLVMSLLRHPLYEVRNAALKQLTRACARGSAHAHLLARPGTTAYTRFSPSTPTSDALLAEHAPPPLAADTSVVSLPGNEGDSEPFTPSHAQAAELVEYLLLSLALLQVLVCVCVCVCTSLYMRLCVCVCLTVSYALTPPAGPYNLHVLLPQASARRTRTAAHSLALHTSFLFFCFSSSSFFF